MSALSTNSIPAAAALHGPGWITKFAVAFFPAFITTGLVFGILYVLIMRAIKVNRKDVEVWFEQQRQRLQSGPVPIIERAQPVMLAGLYAVYGRKPLRRLASSFFIGLFFTCAVFAVVYSHYRLVPANIRELKARLEQEVDPKLYEYATNPALVTEYKKSLEYEMVGAPPGGSITPKYKGGIYDELRARRESYSASLATKLSKNPNRLPLTLLFLIEGSFLSKGFQLRDSIALFLFNVILDFLSVTIAIVCLRRLGQAPSFHIAILTFLCAAAVTIMCLVTAFISYRVFFRGNTGFFFQIIVVLPLSLVALICGPWLLLGPLISVIKRDWSKVKEFLWLRLVWGMALCVLSVGGFGYLWSYRDSLSLGILNWHDFVSFPYILAATTLVPATLTLTAFALTLIAKMTAEPARIVPELYMTFVKEEVGGTQASGIILILGTLAGVIAGLIWTVN